VLSAGIDIGSPTVKMVVVEDGRFVTARRVDTSFDPVAVGTALLESVPYDRIAATGYGRHIFRQHFDCAVAAKSGPSLPGPRRFSRTGGPSWTSAGRPEHPG
jgi:activator of 2-hydroxyglutaryl-CoA dehydratase